MGGKDPISQAVKTVSDTVSTAGKVISNAGDIIGGDAGKALGAVTKPLGGVTEAAGSLIGGDIKGAAARATGAALSAVTVPINASSSGEEALKHETVNTATLGFSNDFVEVNKASNRMISSGEINAEDWSSMSRLGVRTAAVIGTMGAYNAVGGASGIASSAPGWGTSAVNAGKSGVGFLKEAALVAGGAKMLSSDPLKAAGGYLGVDVDDWRNTEKNIKGLVDGVTSSPGTNRTTASTGIATPETSFIPIALAVLAGLIGLIFILKKRRG